MADNYEIRIKTSADLKAAEDLKKALKDQVDATKKLGQDSGELEAQLKKVDEAVKSEAAQTIKLEEAKAKAAEATKKLTQEDKSQETQTKATEAATRQQSTATDKLAASEKKASDATKQLAKEKDLLRGKMQEVLSHIPGFERFSTILSNFGGGMAAKAVAGISAVVAALIAGKKAIQEYAGAEREVAKLDAALAQNGLLIDTYREQLQALASAMQDKTGIADDTWLGVIARLTQFGADPSNIEQITTAVKNLAGIVGDVDTAGDLISKAMQGSYEPFTRYGIVIGEAGSQTEKFEKLCLQLAQRGGGQLEAMNKGLIGQWGQLKNSFSDFMEAIGRGISQTGLLQMTLYGFTETLKFFGNLIGGTIPKLDGLTNAARLNRQSMAENEVSAKKLAEHLETVKKNAENATKAIDGLKHAINEQAKAAIEIVDSELAAKLDDIEALEKLGPKRGGISSDVARRARRAVQLQADVKKFNMEQQRDEDLIAFERSNIAKSKESIEALTNQITADKAALEKVNAFNEAKARLQATQGAFDSTSQSIEQLTADDPRMQEFADHLATLEARLAREREEFFKTRGGVTGEKRSADEIQRNIQRREKELEFRKKNFEDNELESLQRIDDLQRGMKTRELAVPRRIQSRDRVARAEIISEGEKEREQAAEERQKKIVNAAKAGHPAPFSESNARVEQLEKQLAASVVRGDDRAIQVIEGLLELFQNQNPRLNRVEATVRQLLQGAQNTASQLKNNQLQ